MSQKPSDRLVTGLVVLATLAVCLASIWTFPAQAPSPAATDAPIANTPPTAVASSQPTVVAPPAGLRQPVVAAAADVNPAPRPLEPALTVTVWTHDRRPVIGTEVVVELLPRTARARVTATLRTNADGRACFAALPTGTAWVRSARGAEASAAIAPDEPARLDLVLAPGVDVAGVVVSAAGESVAGATIYVSRPATTQQKIDPKPVATSGADGSFALAAVPSGARLGARSPDHGASDLQGIVAGWVAVEPHRIEIRLGPRGANVVGQLRTAVGAPVAGADVELDSGRWRQVPGPRPGDQGQTAWTKTRTRSDSAGRFRFDGAPPGNATLRVDSDDHAPYREALRLAAGESRDVAIELLAGGLLCGRVLDATSGEGIGSAILEHDDFRRTRAFRGAIPVCADQDGRYVYSGLAAGEQKMRFRHDDYASERVSIAVRADEATTFDVRLQRLPRLRGRVVDPLGQALVGVRIRRWLAGMGHPTGLAVLTAADGSFDFPVPFDQAVDLYLSFGTNGIDVDSGIGSIRGPRDNLTIVVDASRAGSATLRGTLVTAGGEPLLAAWLQLRGVGIAGGTQQLRTAGYSDVHDGSFAIHDLIPGRYWLRYQPRDSRVERGELGPFQLAAGQVLDLGVVHACSTGSLIVTLAAASARELAHPPTCELYDAKTESTLASVSVRLDGPVELDVPPGRYRLGAFARGFRRFDSEPFEIESGGHRSVEIRLRRKDD